MDKKKNFSGKKFHSILAFVYAPDTRILLAPEVTFFLLLLLLRFEAIIHTLAFKKGTGRVRRRERVALMPKV